MSDDQKRMPFLQHLAELRSCLLHTVSAIGISAFLSFIWAGALFDFITAPLREHFGDASLIGTGPAEAFLVKLKVSIMCGFLLSAPYTFYQVWRFVSPGLYQKERRLAVPFVLGSSICFFVGVSFCFYVIFPFAFRFFLAEFASIGVQPTIKIGEYLAFAIRLLLVFGTVFELPVLSFFFTRLGLINYRWLIKQGRYAIVITFVMAAILTPPDVVTQVLLALPLIVLYGLCIWISYAVDQGKSEK